MYKSLLINIDEVWLRGKNRRWYTNVLKKNISKTLSTYIDRKSFTVTQEGPKFFIQFEEPITEEAIDALTFIAGIHSLQPCRYVENDLELIKEVAQTELADTIKKSCQEEEPATFRVETRRMNKKFPQTSMEISRQVGGFLKKHFPLLTPKMKKPNHTLHIRVLERGSFISCRQLMGLGGVPVGTTGKAVTLISGGFDSPVASHLLFRRGLEQTFAFFHPAPYVSEDAADKVRRIVQSLAKHQSHTRFYVVPFGRIQEKLSEQAREDYRTLLFRQMMIKVSAQIATKENAKALVMGDSLSQVSSQSLDNLVVLDQTTSLPILRPLIGSNKSEILKTSRKIGIHDISVEPQDDACSLFAPKHPIIRGSTSYTDHFFEENDFSSLIDEAVATSRVLKFDVRGNMSESKHRNSQDLFEF